MGQTAISRLQNMDCASGGAGHTATAGAAASPPDAEITVSDEKIARKIMPASTTTTLASVSSNDVHKRVSNGVTKLKNSLGPQQLARARSPHSPAPTNALEPPAPRLSNRTGPTKLKVCPPPPLSSLPAFFPHFFPIFPDVCSRFPRTANIGHWRCRLHWLAHSPLPRPHPQVQGRLH